VKNILWSEKLWGKDVFVDVKQGINNAIRKIRTALSDDSEWPRYLQSVIGRGYRFLAETTEDVAASSETLRSSRFPLKNSEHSADVSRHQTHRSGPISS
jgi:DNA-binding winged helix-turn-helix (wHTH) protein